MSDINIVYLATQITGRVLIAGLFAFIPFLLYYVIVSAKSQYNVLTGFFFDPSSGQILRLEGYQPGIKQEVFVVKEKVVLAVTPEAIQFHPLTISLTQVVRVFLWKEKGQKSGIAAAIFFLWSMLQLGLQHYPDFTLIFTIALFFFFIHLHSKRTIVRIELQDLRVLGFYYRSGFLKKRGIKESSVLSAIAEVNRLIEKSKSNDFFCF